jgi:uncharacterized membrane protein YesL
METTEYSLLFIVIESHAVSQTSELQRIAMSFAIIIIVVVIIIITIIMFPFFARYHSLAVCQVSDD